ncbi:ribosome maturation factor RimP [Methylomonas sp. AM2-LC]|uniref:ribosome maturation factor RimP n=1 Tax=Methylomonas sp. AM2-LC TaxID=3153301 RepID=UPI003262E30B
MNIAPSFIVDTIEPIIEQLGYECPGIQFIKRNKTRLVVFIDKKDGVTAQDCKKVAYHVCRSLSVDSPIEENDYSLEITSLGDDRPFFKFTQFRKYIGSTIQVKLINSQGRIKKVTGQIQSLDKEEHILIRKGEKVIKIAFSNINQAKLVPEYLINQACFIK